MTILVNDVALDVTVFPDRTSQVWKLSESLLKEIESSNICFVTWHFESEAEFLHLAQLKMLLDTYCDHVHLRIPYFPYARQDKRIANDATFSLRTFAALLNGLRFKMIETIDFHNDMRLSLIHNLVSLPPTPYIYGALHKTKAFAVLFPDLGAKARYKYVMEQLIAADRIYYATKTRDQLSGAIAGVEVPEALTFIPSVLIVDDICDGGATFISLANELQKRNPRQELYLYITHGIFSKGLKPLWDAGFRAIHTHGSEYGPA